MIGATSGIGLAMADRLVQEGSFVIAVGRRQDRLNGFVSKHGTSKAGSVRYDINDRAGLEGFFKTFAALASLLTERRGSTNMPSSVTTKYPEIDCVFLNAGTQSQIKLAQPETVDLASFHNEITTNFNCFVDLSMKFLPFLQQKKTTDTSIISYAHLFLPSTYEAALANSVLAGKQHWHAPSPHPSIHPPRLLRLQSRSEFLHLLSSRPAELHDYLGPTKGRAMGMPVDQFTSEAYAGLQSGSDHVIVGAAGPGSKEGFDEIVRLRRERFEGLSGVIRKMAG
ncbi:MAG: hypothetical protein Q9227_008610 [Pyrenula ochraceoflavens]